MESVSLQAMEQDAYYAVMLVMASTPLDWVSHDSRMFERKTLFLLRCSSALSTSSKL